MSKHPSYTRTQGRENEVSQLTRLVKGTKRKIERVSKQNDEKLPNARLNLADIRDLQKEAGQVVTQEEVDMSLCIYDICDG
jgi:hypothetical protein